MKKVISTLSVLSIVLFIHSRRSLADNVQDSLYDENQNTVVLKKTKDTIPEIDSSGTTYKPIEGDPPPKNGHQW